MKEIIIDPNLEKQLGGLSGQAMVCDSQGRLLGIYSPCPERPRVEDLQLESPLSIAELEELRKVKSGKPLEEILSRLGIQ